ncbi:hypothetical protein FI667_g7857, partial [Globisporangium splendens]
MSAVAEGDVVEALAELVAGVESATLRSEVTSLGRDAERTGLEEILAEDDSAEGEVESDDGGGSNGASSSSASAHEEATSAAGDGLESGGGESSSESEAPERGTEIVDEASESEAESQDVSDSGDTEEETKSSKPPPRDARRREGPRTRAVSRASSKQVQAASANSTLVTGKRVAGGPSVRLKTVVMQVVDVIDYNPATGKYHVLWEDRDLVWEKPDNIRENYGLLLDQAKRWVLETKRKVKFSVWRKKAGPKAFSADHEYQCAFKAVELVFESFGVGSEGMELLKAKYIEGGELAQKQYDVGVTRAQLIGFVKFVQAQSPDLNIDLGRFGSNLVQQPGRKTFSKMRGIELMLDGRSGRFILAAMSQNRERHCMAVAVRGGVITVGDADGWTSLQQRTWLKKADLCWCFEVVLLQPGRKRIRLQRSDF